MLLFTPQLLGGYSQSYLPQYVNTYSMYFCVRGPAQFPVEQDTYLKIEL